MHSDFWLERWRTHQLGWHRDEVNPALVRHWPSVGLDPASKVLVPLCGKTRDMAWLADAGHEVLGCELSDIAAREFFSESNLVPDSRREGRFVRHRGGSVTILEGDVFDLDRSTLADIGGVYDRGALVRTAARHAAALRRRARQPAAAGGAHAAADARVRSVPHRRPALLGARGGGARTLRRP